MKKNKTNKTEIEHVRALILQASDGAELDRLASALARLCEIERITENRPLPGSYRPKPEEKNRAFTH
jgi:hypothetical protein